MSPFGRLYAVLREISAPFNATRDVELKFDLTRDGRYQGEWRVRIPAPEAQRFHVGDHYTFLPIRIDA